VRRSRGGFSLGPKACVRIKRALLLAALLTTAALPDAASAAEDTKDSQRTETIEGLVRIVGAQAGIVLYCRKLYTIDDTVSEGLSRTVRRALDASLGHHQAQSAIAEEGRRVAGEIAAIGAEQWCADQRDILNTDGVRVFVD
jgi:nitrogen fixation/metabolism regulation signal transduction histidine kinase